MNPNLSDWDEDLPPEPEEAYQDLVRALKRKSGFGLFFVQCTPTEADRLIVKLPQDIPQKKIAVLRLVEAIDNLYQRVAEFVKDKQVDILLIKGLEYSLYKYEQRTFGEITEGQFSNLTRVPPILNHLNQQRERFRDDFPICFVFLLRSFSINYLIHRSPDFFDWRSGVFELPTTPKVLEQETSRLLLEGDYEKYLKLSLEKKIEKVLEIQDVLAAKHQTENSQVILLLELGNLLVAAEEYEAAITSYNQAVKCQPDLHEAWYNRGIALDNLGRYEEAIASYDQAVKFQPDDHEAWNSRGYALRNLGRYEEAIASYDQALKIKSDYHEAWYNQGYALGNLERYEEAIASYKQAVKFQPDYHEAWYSLATALDDLGRYEEAIASYDKALKIKPDYHRAWYNRSIALYDLGRYEEAITVDDQAWNNWVIAVRDLRSHQVAIASCQAVKIKPDLHEAWNNRGIVLGNLGRHQEAIIFYDQAVKSKPDDHKAWNNRGIALKNLGRHQEAIRSYDQALKIKPDEHEAWNNRGIALWYLGCNEEAIASYDQALKIKPDKHEAWYNRGIALRHLGRYTEAIESYDQALKIKPDKYEAWYNKSRCYILQGNIEQAIENLEKAIHLNRVKCQDWAKNESDFNSIREDERFVALVPRQHTGD
ncbi:MAG: tetratricopeptide repeat protein [Scytonema hyalinum WJT4-NPBG1]|jgi:superkiller protein 3|nr:tetratricopeptide repeat protein [Scytonema hyalinum WJT4-NPBG1]